MTVYKTLAEKNAENQLSLKNATSHTEDGLAEYFSDEDEKPPKHWARKMRKRAL